MKTVHISKTDIFSFKEITVLIQKSILIAHFRRKTSDFRDT